MKADVCPFVTSVSFGSSVDQKSYKCALVDKGYCFCDIATLHCGGTPSSDCCCRSTVQVMGQE